MADGVEGGFTVDLLDPAHPVSTIYEAAQRYAAAGVPLVVIAGKEYGSGSSRDWAAKGTSLLGVRAVIAESYERIHRSNLIGMGVLPLQFPKGENAATLGLTGVETFDVLGVTAMNDGVTPDAVTVVVRRPDGAESSFEARLRIDTPGEAGYYRSGGILQYVLRSLLG
jgi:aconitate hydratase